MEEAEESDCEEEAGVTKADIVVKIAEMSKKIVHITEWVGESKFIDKDIKYYDKAKVGESWS